MESTTSVTVATPTPAAPISNMDGTSNASEKESSPIPNGVVVDSDASTYHEPVGETHDIEKARSRHEADWETDPKNAFNWSTWKKSMMMVVLGLMALLASISTSIMSPSRGYLMHEFNISGTVALLPLTFYILASGLGPIVGGPLSETIGRYPIYLASVPLGAIFTVGAGFSHNFGALCFMRFMAGFCWAPVLSVAPGSISDMYAANVRGPASAVFILIPFLGPGLGPVIGSFVVVRKDWRWTQWTLIFLAILCMLLMPFCHETFAPVIKRRMAKKRGEPIPSAAPLSQRLRQFASVALLRPLHMIFFEPIVGFVCLYVAVEFGILFSFFAAVPYTFGILHHFTLEQSGLVFLSIGIGCVLGLSTIMLIEVFVYRKLIPKFGSNNVPPEHRLYAAMLGSIGLPVGLFWFAWSAKSEISWASPAAAIIPFAWGNLCVFVSTIQYMSDTYDGNIVASGASANSLARYGLAAVFPLFTIQMYEKLGIDWASSLLGFVSIALMPIPWVLFKYGPSIRAKSKYDTIKYE